QARAISCGQSRPIAQPWDRLQKAHDLFAAEHYRQLLRLLGTDDAVECLGSAQRHAEKEPQRARNLVDVRPRPAKPGQVKLVGANLLDPQAVRRAAEKTAELGNRIDVGLLVARGCEPSCRRSCGDAAASSEPSRDLLSDNWVETTAILSDRSLITPSSLPSRLSGFVQWPIPPGNQRRAGFRGRDRPSFFTLSKRKGTLKTRCCGLKTGCCTARR